MAPRSDLTFSAKVIANLLDITVARVGQLWREGVIDKPVNGKYPASVVPQYVKWLRAKAFGKDIGSGDAQHERTRLIKAQADEREMVVLEMQGELVRVDDVKEEWIRNISNCRSRLLVLPTKMAPELLPIETINEMRNAIKRHIYEALDELSRSQED